MKGAAKKGLICSAFHQQLGGLPRPTGWVPGRLPPLVGRRRDHRAALPSAFLLRECECVSDSCCLPEPLSSRPALSKGGGGCWEGSAQGTLLSSPLAVAHALEGAPVLGNQENPAGDRGGAHAACVTRSGFEDREMTCQTDLGQGSGNSASVPCVLLCSSSSYKFQPSITSHPQFLFPGLTSFCL